MSRVCVVCEKKTVFGNKISHSNRKTRRKWYPNLHYIQILDKSGLRKRVRICSKCLKARKLEKIVS